MLRPATPLSLMLFIAFVLQLLAVLSTPVIKAIPLASFQGVNYGVFGFCSDNDSKCSGIHIGYSTRKSCQLLQTRIAEMLLGFCLALADNESL
jgi:hypothetical protein